MPEAVGMGEMGARVEGMETQQHQQKLRDSRPMKPCSEQSCWMAHLNTEEEEEEEEEEELLPLQWAQDRQEELQEWEVRRQEGDIGIGPVV